MDEIKFFDLDKIHDISFIHLYNKYNTARYFPELVVKYDGIKIKCDYTHPQFSDLLKCVYNLYLQNKDNIIVFDNFDEEEINKALDVKMCDVKDGFVYDDTLRVKFFSDYIWIIVEKIIHILKPDSELDFKSMTGFKNKYVLNYIIDGKDNWVTLLCNLTDDGLSFRFSYLEDEVIPICGEISRHYGALVLKYASLDKRINDSMVYVADDFGMENFDDIINNSARVEEKNIINGYLNIAGLKMCSKVSKVTSNSYLFFDYLNVLDDECQIISGQIYMNDNRVNILYEEKYGLSTFRQYLFMPLDSYSVFVTLEDNMILDINYLPCKVANGEYKKLVSSSDKNKWYVKK